MARERADVGVEMGVIEELALPYDPTRPSATVARRRRLVRSRLISLVITVVVMVAVYLWQPQAFGPGLWVIYGVLVAGSLGWLVAALLALRQARRDVARMGTGTAVRIDRRGVEVAGVSARWPEVVALRVARGGLGRSPVLRLERTTGPPASVPLDQVSVLPATLDSTARAYSAGRHGVDLTALDV